jgi:M6 family metalloprotease-like protein
MKKVAFIIVLLISFYISIPTKVIEAAQYRTEHLSSYSRDIDQEFTSSFIHVERFANVVIFIRFADEIEATAPFNLNYYENMFNASSFKSVSLRDYYLEASYGKLEINSYLISNGSHIIYYDDIHPRAYYQPYNESTNPLGYDVNSQSIRASREHALLKRAIDFVDAGGYISSSVDLDTNNDGEIDALSFLVYGEDNGWNSLLWPHQWELYSYYNFGSQTFKSDAPKINGVNAYAYTFQLMGNSANYNYAVDVFVLAHEMFHVLGAPDLYHYDGYSYIDNVGPWGLMDYNSTIPPHMIGHMKDYYGGWMSNVIEINKSGSYSLYALQDGDDHLIRINTQYSNEYVYLEFREKKGNYESQIPYSGLLVYRVDFDNAGTGNRDGYYGADGQSNNEVFVFRPGIQDFIPPIEFPAEATSNFDGNINRAALSNQDGYYNAAGKNSGIMMFHSDGSLMNLSISNVIVFEGYVTFDVTMPASLELISDQKPDVDSQLILWNDPAMNYQVRINNIGNQVAYYTLDGSEPTVNDYLYEESIYINARQNRVRVSIFNTQGTIISEIDQTFTFSQDVSAGPNYGNNQNITWLIQPNSFISNFTIDFGNLSYLEADYDYVYITYQGNKTTYTGSELEGLILTDIVDTVLIQLVSDYSESNFQGFQTRITYDQYFPMSLFGKEQLNYGTNSFYEELGADIHEDYLELYRLKIFGLVNTEIAGVNFIYYHLVDERNLIVFTLERKVTMINDVIFPSFDLITNQTIELGSNPFDWTVLITNPVDNTDGLLTTGISENLVNYNQKGVYRVILSLTDESGNQYLQTFYVNVVDTIAPQVSLLPGIDTIYQSDDFIDQGVSYSDYDSEVTVLSIGEVDTLKVGTYEISYIVYDSSNNFTFAKRFVNVLPAPKEVTFELGEAKTTVVLGESYQDGYCYVFIDGILENCTLLESNLDVNEVGTYYITYGIEVNQILYTYKRYLFVVLDHHVEEDEINITYFYKKEEEGFIQ